MAHSRDWPYPVCISSGEVARDGEVVAFRANPFVQGVGIANIKLGSILGGSASDVHDTVVEAQSFALWQMAFRAKEGDYDTVVRVAINYVPIGGDRLMVTATGMAGKSNKR